MPQEDSRDTPGSVHNKMSWLANYPLTVPLNARVQVCAFVPSSVTKIVKSERHPNYYVYSRDFTVGDSNFTRALKTHRTTSYRSCAAMILTLSASISTGFSSRCIQLLRNWYEKESSQNLDHNESPTKRSIPPTDTIMKMESERRRTFTMQCIVFLV